MIAILASHKATDAVFSKESIKNSPNEATNPLIPELKLRRTVICFQLHELIYKSSPEVIAKEVQKAQPWTNIN